MVIFKMMYKVIKNIHQIRGGVFVVHLRICKFGVSQSLIYIIVKYKQESDQVILRFDIVSINLRHIRRCMGRAFWTRQIIANGYDMRKQFFSGSGKMVRINFRGGGMQ